MPFADTELDVSADPIRLGVPGRSELAEVLLPGVSFLRATVRRMMRRTRATA